MSITVADKPRKTSRKKSGGSKHQPNRTGVPFHTYIDPHLADNFRRLARTVNRRSVTLELVIALENHLKAAGIDPYAPLTSD